MDACDDAATFGCRMAVAVTACKQVVTDQPISRPNHARRALLRSVSISQVGAGWRACNLHAQAGHAGDAPAPLTLAGIPIILGTLFSAL